VSRQSQRDQSLERLLKESLRTPLRAPQPGSCLDAETLAAWVDGSLAGGQLAAAQEHAADCVACQSTLAALARATPAAVSRERWWPRGLNARWLVPVAATATALAIWVAVPRDEYTRPPEQESAAAARTPLPQTEATSEPSAAADAPVSSGDRGAEPRPLEQRAAEPSAAASEGASAGARSVAAPPLEQSASEFRLEATEKTAAVEAPTERQDAVGRSEALAPQAAAPAAVSAEADERRDNAPAAGRAEARAQQPAAPAPAPAQAARSEALSASLAPPRVEIVSPNGSSRWRIGPAGAIEYSTNAGGSWQATPSGVTADLTAGASPSGTVCWVVGRTGTVLVTTDGRQWRRLTFPVAVDLAAVQATDARTAAVTSRDGRRFRTDDGGATWESL